MTAPSRACCCCSDLLSGLQAVLQADPHAGLDAGVSSAQQAPRACPTATDFPWPPKPEPLQCAPCSKLKQHQAACGRAWWLAPAQCTSTAAGSTATVAPRSAAATAIRCATGCAHATSPWSLGAARRLWSLCAAASAPPGEGTLTASLILLSMVSGSFAACHTALPCIQSQCGPATGSDWHKKVKLLMILPCLMP